MEKDKILDVENKNFKNIELLAPVGNMQSLISAINGGANAVYLGLDDFNARGNIDNFSKDNLKDAVDKAHLFGVKVYLTLNILFKDDEIEEVLNLVEFALKSKIDAFIVQDIGVAHLLFQQFDGIELHASTQMGVHNLEGAKIIESLGFKRVVLARETPLSEIKRIHDETNLEIEYFVQGALCVGFSGNCYLCSLLAGASGNRGKCKQFCRLKYKINGGEEGYYLSTKDFCMIRELKDLINCGVISLKIEGRARRPAYVSTAVQTYRKVLDNNLKYESEDIENLKKVFNRGDFISGYFKDEKIIYSKVQNHIGVKIGIVESFKAGKRFNEIIINSTHILRKGDAIKLFDGEKEVVTVSPADIKVVGNNRYLFTTTAVAKKGQIVRLIVDSKFEQEILNKERKIEFDAIVKTEELTLKIILQAVGQKVEKVFDNILSPAKSQPLSENDIYQSFTKCGDEFKLKSLTCELGNVFLRKSDLNEVRRIVLKSLKEQIITSNESKIFIKKRDNFKISTQKPTKNNEKILIFDKIEKIKEISEEKLKDYKYYVYSPLNYIYEDIKNVNEYLKNKNFFLDMPLIATNEDIKILKQILNSIKDLGVYATNYYALDLVKPDKTIIGSELNVINSFSIDYYTKKGYRNIVLSKEEFDFENLTSKEAKLFIDNRKPRLIYFKHCPFKEHFASNCANCKYRENINYSLGNERLTLERKKVVNCHFYLKRNISLFRQSSFGFMEEI